MPSSRAGDPLVSEEPQGAERPDTDPAMHACIGRTPRERRQTSGSMTLRPLVEQPSNWSGARRPSRPKSLFE